MDWDEYQIGSLESLESIPFRHRKISNRAPGDVELGNGKWRGGTVRAKLNLIISMSNILQYRSWATGKSLGSDLG
jgi:hypothetical protein